MRTESRTIELSTPPTSRLAARFELRGERTVLADQYHSAPLKIAKTFRLPDEHSALYVHMMDASPGIMDGDAYHLSFQLDKGSHVYLTNQSFTKIHPTPRCGSRMIQRFRLAEETVLEYFPEPIIPYEQSRFVSDTQFHLAQGAVVFFGEVTTPGRTHRGERFAFTSFSSKTEAYVQDRLINWDHFYLEPAVHRFETIGALDGFTHYATLWIWAQDCEESIVHAIRVAVGKPADMAVGVSLSGEYGIAMRLLARNVWQAQEALRAAWDAARKMLLGRPAPAVRR